LQVSIEARRLTISGKRQTNREDTKKGKTVYEEKCSSEMLRIVDLPVEVDTTKTTATLKNGILTLNLTKGAPAKTARVDIKTA
jgi:HSP20 family protein